MLVALALLAGCGPSAVYCRPDSDPAVGSRCLGTGGPASAAATAGTAAAMWGVAGGCKQRGCELPRQCNANNGLCEPIPCGENGGCPPATRCNQKTNECEL